MYAGILSTLFNLNKIKCKASQSLSKLSVWIVYVFTESSSNFYMLV